MRNLINFKSLTKFRGQYVPNNPTDVKLPVKQAKDFKMAVYPKDAAPFAYNDYYEFPDTYEPWKLNYQGHGLFVGVLLIYEQTYLNRTGQKKRNPNKVYYQP